MTEAPFNWPKKGHKAFKLPDRAALDAFIMPDDGIYMVGFKRAGDMIVTAAQAEGPHADDLLFPIAHLYRHHLELMLKELVRLGVQIGSLEGCEDLLVQHNLHKLWNMAKRLIKEVWPDSLGEDDLNATERMILEFHKLDPTGQAFRYARDKQGEPHLQNAPRCVDLNNLMAAVDGVSRFLDATYAGIESCDSGPL